MPLQQALCFQLILFDLIGKDGLFLSDVSAQNCFQLILFDLIGKAMAEQQETIVLLFPTNPI